MFHRSSQNTFSYSRTQKPHFQSSHKSRAALPPRYRKQGLAERPRPQYQGSPYYNDEIYQPASPRVRHGYDSYEYYEESYEYYEQCYIPQKAKYDQKYESRDPREFRNNCPRTKYNKHTQNMHFKKGNDRAPPKKVQVYDSDPQGLKVDTGYSFNCDAPFFKKSDLYQPIQNFDERTQLSDEDDTNQNKYGQTEILSGGRGRFLSVDNLDDSKTDFGIKDNQSYDKSEQPGKVMNGQFYNLGLNKIDDCQLSISAIPENEQKVQFEGQSAFDVSSTSSEKSSMKHANCSQDGEQILIAENMQTDGFDQKSYNLNYQDEEEDDIYIDDSLDTKCKQTSTMSTSGKNGDSSINSERSCISSVEAQPFYPTKSTSNSIQEPNFSENLSYSDANQTQSFYNQMGSVKDQIQYQNKFLTTQKFKRVHKVEQSAANNPFAFKDNGRIMSKDYKIKIKTELCRTFTTEGICPYGDTCAFAHGDHELQKKKHVPSRYKTKLCQQFHESSYCPYGNRCQFIHSTKLNEMKEKKQTENEKPSDNSVNDLKSFLSHKQMLNDNIECLKQRLTSSQNPYLNEFNLIYKDVIKRLPVFEAITNDATAAKQDVQIQEDPQQQRLVTHLEQEYAILEKKLQANLRAQAEYKAKQRMAQRAQIYQEYQYQQYMETDQLQQQKYNHSITVFSSNNY